jgi:hypothetical protein
VELLGEDAIVVGLAPAVAGAAALQAWVQD